MTKKYTPFWKDVYPSSADDTLHPVDRRVVAVPWNMAVSMLVKEIRTDAVHEHTPALIAEVAVQVVLHNFVPGQTVRCSDFEYSILEAPE